MTDHAHYAVSSYLASLKYKYLPQHPILKHPQPMFLSQCDRPCFTTTRKIRF